MANAEKAVAVYCGASLGVQKSFHSAAESVGKALAAADRRLIYGGGSHGIMGIVSGAVLDSGGKVTGVIPRAILASGGEGRRLRHSNTITPDFRVYLEVGRESVETIVVNSMHERKVEMATRSCGFVGLPGGFGTFEEVLEVTTWTQLGIHTKPVILVNVLSFFNPLRQLIQNGIDDGFIQPENASLITFIDGPDDAKDHETYNWGKAVLSALDDWDNTSTITLGFDWTTRMDGSLVGKGLEAS